MWYRPNNYGLSSKATLPVFQSHTVWLRNFPKYCSNSALWNLFWNEYCFNYKQKAAAKRGVVINSCFLWKLTFHCKNFYILLYNPICGLLFFLSYWESINSQNTWLLENNRVLSKFLYGILHYIISIIKL